MKKDPGLYMGVAEAAAYLGMKKSNFSTRTARKPGFPEPVARLKMGPIWRTSDVILWNEWSNRK